jgi:AcrR family transcriptional regulator
MVRLTKTARNERTEERRGQILRGALEVFGRRGFHGATIREIASQAGLAEGTIYLYFPSKQDVLKGAFALIAEEAAAPPDGPSEEDDAAFLTSFIRNRIQSLGRHASLLRLIAHEADLREDLRHEFVARLHEQFVTRLEAYLRRRIAQGAFRPMNTVLAASICFRLMMSYVMVHRVLELDSSTVRYTEEEHIAEMVALILYGLTARPSPAGTRNTQQGGRFDNA